MKLIRIKELEEITGLSRTTIWRLEKNGKFPKKVKISSRLIGWRSSDIENWIKNINKEGETKCN